MGYSKKLSLSRLLKKGLIWVELPKKLLKREGCTRNLRPVSEWLSDWQGKAMIRLQSNKSNASNNHYIYILLSVYLLCWRWPLNFWVKDPFFISESGVRVERMQYRRWGGEWAGWRQLPSPTLQDGGTPLDSDLDQGAGEEANSPAGGARGVGGVVVGGVSIFTRKFEEGNRSLFLGGSFVQCDDIPLIMAGGKIQSRK